MEVTDVAEGRFQQTILTFVVEHLY